MEIQCDKCGCGMIKDSSFEIESYRCWNCGNRHYPGYPKRPGNIELSATCGEEFERQQANAVMCGPCNEIDPYRQMQRRAEKKRRQKKMEVRHVSV